MKGRSEKFGGKQTAMKDGVYPLFLLSLSYYYIILFSLFYFWFQFYGMSHKILLPLLNTYILLLSLQIFDRLFTYLVTL